MDPRWFAGVPFLGILALVFTNLYARVRSRIPPLRRAVAELAARPTTPAGSIAGPGRYEVQGVLEPSGEPLRSPFTETPAVWWRHDVVEERWVHVRSYSSSGSGTRLVRRDTIVDSRAEAAPTVLRDGSGAIPVDLTAGTPEAPRVWDRRRPRLLWTVLGRVALVYLGLLLLVVGAIPFDIRAAGLLLYLLFPLLPLGMLLVVGAIPAYLFWKLFAPRLPPRVRDRVYAVPVGSPCLMVADAIPAGGGRYALSHDPKLGEGILISLEQEDARARRIEEEIRGLQARARLCGLAAGACVLGALGLGAWVVSVAP